MVSVARMMMNYATISLVWFCFFKLVIDLRLMHTNVIPQSVIKPDMKIKLRLDGALNGHKFVIEGDGNGNPFQ